MMISETKVANNACISFAEPITQFVHLDDNKGTAERIFVKFDCKEIC
jgi:hypothetical protein